ALGVAGPRRTPVLPDLPTISETGLPGFDTTVWFGLFAPASTAMTIVELVNGKVNAVLGSPRVKQSLKKLGIEAAGGSPDILAQRVQGEIEKWAAIVREKNIHVDQ